jgi:hypothetical protein
MNDDVRSNRQRNNDAQDAMDFLAVSGVCEYQITSTSRNWKKRIARRDRYYQVTVEALSAINQGMTLKEVNRYVCRECRSFNPLTWLTILRIILKVVPMIWDWWQKRKKERV